MMQLAFQHAAGPHTGDGRMTNMSWPRCADWLLDKGCLLLHSAVCMRALMEDALLW